MAAWSPAFTWVVVLLAVLLLGGPILAFAGAQSQTAIQLVVGALVVLIVYSASLLVLRSDSLVVVDTGADKDPRRRTAVVDGYVPLSSAVNRKWTTVNPDARNYAAMPRSLNRKGGAQFTYSFWLYVTDTAAPNLANQVILLRGDKARGDLVRTDVWGSSDPAAYEPPTTSTTTMDNTLIAKCPCIRFGDTYDSFVVELNTVHDPNYQISIVPNAGSDDDTVRTNVLKLARNKWVMHTFTFEDHVAINDFEDGVIVKYYVNDTLYHTAQVGSTLRQNNGDLYLMPDAKGSFDDSRIGDVTYRNYAIAPEDVHEVFQRGPPRTMAKQLVGGVAASAPLFLSEYNKLDMYNT